MCSVVVALAGVGAGAAHVGLARAADSTCAGVRILTPPSLPLEWAEALSSLGEKVPTASNARCAAITLSLDANAAGVVRLEAMAADGRYAERVVARPAALAATALGLVASIPPEESPPRSPAPEAAPASTSALPRISSAPEQPASARSGDHLSLGASAGLRFGGAFSLPMLDFEGRADLFRDRWLLSPFVRYGFSVGPDLDDYQYEELVTGAGLGRRFAAGHGALDVSIVPALALMWLQWDQDDPRPRSGGGQELRVGAAVRWSSPIGGVWSLTLTADADVAPFELQSPIQLGSDAPALPAWTAGLRMGTSGAVL
jgi:hypothetical protein